MFLSRFNTVFAVGQIEHVGSPTTCNAEEQTLRCAPPLQIELGPAKYLL